MNWTLLIVLIVVNTPLYYLFWKWIFKEWEVFGESLRFWFTPDILSIFRGELETDVLSEMRLWWWTFLCTAVVGLEYYGIYMLFCV